MAVYRSDADGGEDEVDDGVGEKGDNETDDGVENGVFGVGDFFAIATRDDITEAAVEKHNDRNEADCEKDDIGDASNDAVRADKFGWHTFGTSGLGAFFDTSESHGLAGV